MAPQIRRILFATDLTENSRPAFHYASALAYAFGASVVLLHVVESLPGGTRNRIDLLVGERAWEQLRESREKSAKNVLIAKRADDLVVRRALADFYGARPDEGSRSPFDDYEIVLEEGRVAEQIVKSAEEHECQLIVMGGHKGLFGTHTLGKNAKGVLGRATVPVLVVPYPKEG